MKTLFKFDYGIIGCMSIWLLWSCQEKLPDPELSLQSPASATSTTVTVTDRNPDTFRQSLINAINQAGNGGTVKLLEGDYLTNRPIVLPHVQINIVGAGKNNTTIKLEQNPGPTSGLLILRTNGTTIKDLTINAKNNLQYGACGINTNGATDVIVERVRISNASIGVGTPDNGTGKNPAGLQVLNSNFWNCDHGFNFVRQYSQVQIPWVKKLVFRNCTFGGKMTAGISIDCGNDGTDGVLSRRALRGAAEATATITNMDGTEISGCTFEKAGKYNIAISKAWNVDIFNNTLKGNTGSIPFGEAINIEHEAYDITIEGNTITNEGLSNQEHAYISLLTFRDYGNPPLLENGCRNIIIRNNQFKGDVRTGITGEYARAITINGNTFQTPRPTRYDISFYVQSTNIWRWDNGNVNENIVN
ncbi:MAG: right-handed parallel beta-helix repeat-containing protein [Bacteroidota bacterium]